MFSSKPSTGLSINTNSANSLFGGGNTQPSSTATPAATGTTGSLFGNPGASNSQTKPSGGLFGNIGPGNNQQTQPSGSNMFSGLGGQQSNTGTGVLFGGSTTTSQAQQGGLFPGTASTNNNPSQTGTTGGLFGNTGASSTTQAQPKPLFSLGSSTTTGGGMFGGNQGPSQPQQQQQQAQKPTLSLFGNQSTTAQPQDQQTTATGTVLPGVKVDLSNLLPTTKYESCADEIKSELERFDTFVLNQINMSNEVGNLIPSITAQGETIPNDVEYVQGKLETMQHALENDASDIDQLRGLVSRDAAEAQVAFRAIDTLKLPLQYQSAGGVGWWSTQDQKVSDRQSLRSTRKNTLALPDDVEVDPATATTINGVPVNLVEYFSQRSDEMGAVLERYIRNLKEIEDHLHGVEATLERQIHDFSTSRNRDGTSIGAPKSVLNDLAAVLGDVESGIIGVASRLGGVTEQVQEVVLGPPTGTDGRLNL